MGEPARKHPRGRVLRPLLPTGGGGPGGQRDPAESRESAQQQQQQNTTTTTTTTTPPPVVDELLEARLRGLRFRGARAFLWRYREHLEVVEVAVQELQDATDEEAWAAGSSRIRNPGGWLRWRVRQEAGDGDA